MTTAWFAAPTSLSPGAALGSWSLALVPTLGIAVGAVLYAEAVGSIRRTGGPPVPRARVICFMSGLLVVFVALASPIDSYATLLLSDHMIQHLLLTMVAAPLVLLGTPVLVALRASPARIRQRVLVPVLRSWPIRWLSSPVLGWAAFAIVMWGTHVQAVYEAAVRSETIHSVEHLAYFASALLFWRPVVGLEPGPGRLSHPARLLYLFLAMPVTSLLGLAISASSHVLYPSYIAGANLLGVSPLSDQRLAGTLMWTVGMFLMVPAIGVVLVDWLRRDEQQAIRSDARHAPQPG